MARYQDDLRTASYAELLAMLECLHKVRGERFANADTEGEILHEIVSRFSDAITEPDPISDPDGG